MSPCSIAQWEAEVQDRLPVLSRPQARVLAYWSCAVVLCGTCGLTTVSTFLQEILGAAAGTWRQRLREWVYPATAKRGPHRRSLEVQACFPALLRWVVALWPPGEQRLALALDATTLGDRFTVLAVSVVVSGCAIPVAWHVVGATTPGSWRPLWCQLFAPLRAAVPTQWEVVVLADRGLYAEWLFRAIVQQGWHPFLRINTQGLYQLAGGSAWRALREVAPRPGTQWAGRVHCFKGRPVTATLLAAWDAAYHDAWLVLTDLAPEPSSIVWYRLRAWIEQGFKDLKRGGWQWQQTRMQAPDRAERLWLVLAVATLWTVSVGCATAAWPTRAEAPPRRISGFRQGMLIIRAALLRGDGIVLGRLVAPSWTRPLPLHAWAGSDTYP